MFKIKEPELNNLTQIEYQKLQNKDKIENYKFNNETIELNKSVDINSSVFNDVTFNKVSINFGKLEDIEFINCDLSNLSFINTTFYRVRFKNCKLFGINFIDAEFDSVIIENSLCNISNLASVKIKNSKIVNSNFKDSRILSCNFKNTIIEDVNFSNSEIINCSLNDIDLSNNNIENIKIDLNSIKGAIISLDQSMDLINLLGVKIKR